MLRHPLAHHTLAPATGRGEAAVLQLQGKPARMSLAQSTAGSPVSAHRKGVLQGVCLRYG